MTNGWLAAANGYTDWSHAALVVSPRVIGPLEITLFHACLRDDVDLFVFLVIHVANPCESITAILNNDVANSRQENPYERFTTCSTAPCSCRLSSIVSALRIRGMCSGSNCTATIGPLTSTT